MSTEHYEQIGVAMTCRSFDEYQTMFALDHGVMSQGEILDVAAGASSFVAEANGRGYAAFAVDPLYKLSSEEIKERGGDEIVSTTEKIDQIQHLH
ncbi:hypothetical protein [Desmospora activa]|uniref:hypothetical protein n=1 Tax=Desmospora activa TaxID=500615 RepID=UPI0026819F68